MAAYRLEAVHSLSKDRTRGQHRNDGVISIKCTLIVFLLALQPRIDAAFRSTQTPRRGDIRIHDVTSRPEFYGARIWEFTVTLETEFDRLRTQNRRGRPLSMPELRALPLELLGYVERAIDRLLFEVAGPVAGSSIPSTATLQIVD